MSTFTGRIRPTAVASQFYPSDASALERDVDDMLAAVPDRMIHGRIVAIVAPHAGYVYSARTAAYAYHQVAGVEYDAVIVIAPSHRDTFSGVSIMAHGAYQTPLGLVPIHEQIANNLLDASDDIQDIPAGHGLEHAVEVQLPFIQRAIGDVPIVPLVMLDTAWPACRALAKALITATNGLHVLVVASSDLYHGYSDNECRELDAQTLSEAESVGPEEFCDDLGHGRVQACGGAPIVVVKEYARLMGANGARVLSHTTSSEAIGKSGGYVVGYGALAYFFTDKDVQASNRADDELNDEEKAVLLELARQSIRAAVLEKELPVAPTEHARLLAPQGVFVTIRNKGELRGCIGRIVTDRPLAETLIDMAEAAAAHDTRFTPVAADELQSISLDISVMSELRGISSADDVIVGTHGIVVSGRGHRGLLLPQVAVEQKWDREHFLHQACLKAGLPALAWQDEDVTLEVFSAQVFKG